MNFQINKTKFWWGMIGLIILVLGGANIRLYLVTKSMTAFIGEEIKLDSKRIQSIQEFRHQKQ